MGLVQTLGRQKHLKKNQCMYINNDLNWKSYTPGQVCYTGSPLFPPSETMPTI